MEETTVSVVEMMEMIPVAKAHAIERRELNKMEKRLVAVSKLAKDRTTFVVAHRLSTIRNADKIAVMEKGGMKEFGNYEELMELKGSFYNLMEMQQG